MRSNAQSGLRRQLGATYSIQWLASCLATSERTALFGMGRRLGITRSEFAGEGCKPQQLRAIIGGDRRQDYLVDTNQSGIGLCMAGSDSLANPDSGIARLSDND